MPTANGRRVWVQKAIPTIRRRRDLSQLPTRRICRSPSAFAVGMLREKRIRGSVLSDHGREYLGGLHLAAGTSSNRFVLPLSRGDAVVHQSDLLHGVSVASGERWSWILWYRDSSACAEHGRVPSPFFFKPWPRRGEHRREWAEIETGWAITVYVVMAEIETAWAITVYVVMAEIETAWGHNYICSYGRNRNGLGP